MDCLSLIKIGLSTSAELGTYDTYISILTLISEGFKVLPRVNISRGLSINKNFFKMINYYFIRIHYNLNHRNITDTRSTGWLKNQQHVLKFKMTSPFYQIWFSGGWFLNGSAVTLPNILVSKDFTVNRYKKLLILFISDTNLSENVRWKSQVCL